MNRYKLALFFLMLSDCVGAKTLSPYEASYRGYWHGLQVAAGTHKLNVAQNTYTIVSLSKPLAILPFRYYEKSIFTLKGNKVIPKLYEFKHIEKSKEKAGSIQFTAEDIALAQANHKVCKFNLQHNSYDELSYLVQLQMDLAQGCQEFSYDVIKINKRLTYTFKIIDKTILKTSLGKIPTIVLSHKDEANQRATYLWLAPDYDFLMVKVQKFKQKRLQMEARISTYKLL